MIRIEPLGVEARFLIPVKEDRDLGSGKPHAAQLWRWLHEVLRERFGGFTASVAAVRGSWKDAETGQFVEDESRQYAIALQRSDALQLRMFLAEEVAPVFVQKCIYLAVGPDAELVWNATL